jgi:hypothetical protein
MVAGRNMGCRAVGPGEVAVLAATNINAECPSGKAPTTRVRLLTYRLIVERETRLELATSTLARLRLNSPKYLIYRNMHFREALSSAKDAQ